MTLVEFLHLTGAVLRIKYVVYLFRTPRIYQLIIKLIRATFLISISSFFFKREISNNDSVSDNLTCTLSYKLHNRYVPIPFLLQIEQNKYKMEIPKS